MKFSIDIKYKLTLTILLALSVLMMSSCRKFLQVPVNPSEMLAETVFSDDENAVSAVRGIYSKMVISSFAGGGGSGFAILTGLSSDELHNVLQDASYIP